MMLRYVLRYVSPITSDIRGKCGLATSTTSALQHPQNRPTTRPHCILWTQTRQHTPASLKARLCTFTGLKGILGSGYGGIWVEGKQNAVWGDTGTDTTSEEDYFFHKIRTIIHIHVTGVRGIRYASAPDEAKGHQQAG